MAESAEFLLKVARGEIGVKESPAGSNNVRYNTWYYGRTVSGNYPWCAAFVSWCLDKADISGFKHAYTPTGAQLFQQAKRWHGRTATPKPGDVAYFDFPDSTFRIQHVGFVVRDNGNGTITTIEGNTSQTSQDNGGEVQLRVRPKSQVVGYGRPPYDERDSFVVKAVKKRKDTVRGRADAKKLAEHLRKLGFKVTIDKKGR